MTALVERGVLRPMARSAGRGDRRSLMYLSRDGVRVVVYTSLAPKNFGAAVEAGDLFPSRVTFTPRSVTLSALAARRAPDRGVRPRPAQRIPQGSAGPARRGAARPAGESVGAQGRAAGGLLAIGGRVAEAVRRGMGDFPGARRRSDLCLEPLLPALQEGPAPIGRAPASEFRGMTAVWHRTGRVSDATAQELRAAAGGRSGPGLRRAAVGHACGRRGSRRRRLRSRRGTGQSTRRRRVVRHRRLVGRPARRHWLRVAIG